MIFLYALVLHHVNISLIKAAKYLWELMYHQAAYKYNALWNMSNSQSKLENINLDALLLYLLVFT